MSLFFRRYSSSSFPEEPQQLKGSFINGRFQRNVNSNPVKKEKLPTTQKVKKVVLEAPAKSPTNTTFFVPPKQQSQPSQLAKRTQVERPSSPPAPPALALTMQNQTFLSTLPSSCRALRVFSSSLESATSNQEVWSAVTTLNDDSPQTAELLNRWLLDTIHEVPSQTANEVNSFLRSESGKILVGGLLRAFQDLQSKTNRLKHYVDLYRAFEKSSGRPEQFKSKLWSLLPKDVQSTLSRQVYEISQPTHSIDHFGRTEIEKKPSILYSLNGRNILQEQIQQLEQQFTPTLTRHLEESRKKCINKLLKVDAATYKDQQSFAMNELRRLRSLQAVLMNYSAERRNETLCQFFKLDEQTTAALLHAIWIADNSPMFVKNRDLELGLHLFESNPMLLLNIKEDHVDGSLIDWAIQFYENQIMRYETIATLDALEKIFGDRISTHTLMWAFYSCDKAQIQDPLIEQMNIHGLTEEAFRIQPGALVMPPSFDALSPLAEVILKKKKECELPITALLKQAQKTHERFGSNGSSSLASVGVRLHIGLSSNFTHK